MGFLPSGVRQRCRLMTTASRTLRQYPNGIVTTPLSRVDSTDDSIADVLRPHYENQTPVIVQDYARTWPAVSKWNNNWDYLRDRVGADWACDVEMGAYNTNERLSIPFESYLDYLALYREQQQSVDEGKDTKDDEESSSSPILYLAQNDLPHGLYGDIVLPSFLKTTTEHHAESAERASAGSSPILGQGKLYQCMFWMGPPRTESPLHFDPLDNLLVQIVGTKQVALLDPSTTPRERLAAGAAFGQQENTSALPMRDLLRQNGSSSSSSVSADGTDDLTFFSGTLEPGDALFIPAKWWHYVQSPADFTISVNVWWR